ncbi:MAG: hypothetical protein ABSB71_13175 [Candidatus Bathyarchaeia archaeon]|jgi:hypothetical protein
MNNEQPILLVGDNPFHGISHLSQQSVKKRGNDITLAKYASDIVKISIENGANGFMFSVSETTLSILHKLPEKEMKERLNLYALVPYAYEYVRLATHAGGLPGLAKRFAKEVLLSGNLKTAGVGLKGVLTSNPIDVMKAYLSYEIIRVKAFAKNRGTLRSVLLHEVITDMAIALNLESLIKSYIKFMEDHGIEPGFETRNFSYLVKKFKDWDIDFEGLVLAAPFNKIGFYMNPSKAECEKALADVSGSTVIMMSILAAGYLKPTEAIDYVRGLPNATAIVVGVSNEQQARETFNLLTKTLKLA